MTAADGAAPEAATARRAGPLRVDRLGARGDGLARLGDDVVAVARALPGEMVEGAVHAGRIAEPRIVVPAPERVAPPCPHFRRCGGCALQHASDPFVAAWKVGRVRDALAGQGLAATIKALHTSPPASRRRAALKGRKTKRGATVGFHAARSHDLVAIPDCRLLAPALMAALPALEDLARVAAPRGGEIGLHLTATTTGLDLDIGGAKPLDAAALAPFAETFARISLDGEPAITSVRPELLMGSARVVPPPGAFLQATAAGEAALVAAILPALRGAGRVTDLFAGLGTFAFPAAREAAVDAWEGEARLVTAMRDGARRATGLRPLKAAMRDLFRDPLSAHELGAYDAAIIDPPRAGAAAQAAGIAASDLPVLAYVSCNPDTFARDAAILVRGGYAMGPVTVVDQFRWSPHVELAAVFRRQT